VCGCQWGEGSRGEPTVVNEWNVLVDAMRSAQPGQSVPRVDGLCVLYDGRTVGAMQWERVVSRSLRIDGTFA